MQILLFFKQRTSRSTEIITAMPTVYVCVHVWHYYMYVCVFVCVYLNESVCMYMYMHVYKHLHGISLRQTGISCKNTATQCHSNVILLCFILTFFIFYFYFHHSLSHTATPLPLVSNSTSQPSASLCPSHLSLLATHFGFLRNTYLSTML